MHLNMQFLTTLITIFLLGSVSAAPAVVLPSSLSLPPAPTNKGAPVPQPTPPGKDGQAMGPKRDDPLVDVLKGFHFFLDQYEKKKNYKAPSESKSKDRARAFLKEINDKNWRRMSPEERDVAWKRAWDKESRERGQDLAMQTKFMYDFATKLQQKIQEKGEPDGRLEKFIKSPVFAKENMLPALEILKKRAVPVEPTPLTEEQREVMSNKLAESMHKHESSERAVESADDDKPPPHEHFRIFSNKVARALRGPGDHKAEEVKQNELTDPEKYFTEMWKNHGPGKDDMTAEQKENTNGPPSQNDPPPNPEAYAKEQWYTHHWGESPATNRAGHLSQDQEKAAKAARKKSVKLQGKHGSKLDHVKGKKMWDDVVMSLRELRTNHHEVLNKTSAPLDAKDPSSTLDDSRAVPTLFVGPERPVLLPRALESDEVLKDDSAPEAGHGTLEDKLHPHPQPWESDPGHEVYTPKDKLPPSAYDSPHKPNDTVLATTTANAIKSGPELQKRDGEVEDERPTLPRLPKREEPCHLNGSGGFLHGHVPLPECRRKMKERDERETKRLERLRHNMRYHAGDDPDPDHQAPPKMELDGSILPKLRKRGDVEDGRMEPPCHHHRGPHMSIAPICSHFGNITENDQQHPTKPKIGDKGPILFNTDQKSPMETEIGGKGPISPKLPNRDAPAPVPVTPHPGAVNNHTSIIDYPHKNHTAKPQMAEMQEEMRKHEAHDLVLEQKEKDEEEFQKVERMHKIRHDALEVASRNSTTAGTNLQYSPTERYPHLNHTVMREIGERLQHDGLEAASRNSTTAGTNFQYFPPETNRHLNHTVMREIGEQLQNKSPTKTIDVNVNDSADAGPSEEPLLRKRDQDAGKEQFLQLWDMCHDDNWHTHHLRKDQPTICQKIGHGNKSTAHVGPAGEMPTLIFEEDQYGLRKRALIPEACLVPWDGPHAGHNPPAGCAELIREHKGHDAAKEKAEQQQQQQQQLEQNKPAKTQTPDMALILPRLHEQQDKPKPQRNEKFHATHDPDSHYPSNAEQKPSGTQAADKTPFILPKLRKREAMPKLTLGDCLPKSFPRVKLQSCKDFLREHGKHDAAQEKAEQRQELERKRKPREEAPIKIFQQWLDVLKRRLCRPGNFSQPWCRPKDVVVGGSGTHSNHTGTTEVEERRQLDNLVGGSGAHSNHTGATEVEERRLENHKEDVVGGSGAHSKHTGATEVEERRLENAKEEVVGGSGKHSKHTGATEIEERRLENKKNGRRIRPHWPWPVYFRGNRFKDDVEKKDKLSKRHISWDNRYCGPFGRSCLFRNDDEEVVGGSGEHSQHTGAMEIQERRREDMKDGLRIGPPSRRDVRTTRFKNDMEKKDKLSKRLWLPDYTKEEADRIVKSIKESGKDKDMKAELEKYTKAHPDDKAARRFHYEKDENDEHEGKAAAAAPERHNYTYTEPEIKFLEDGLKRAKKQSKSKVQVFVEWMREHHRLHKAQEQRDRDVIARLNNHTGHRPDVEHRQRFNNHSDHPPGMENQESHWSAHQIGRFFVRKQAEDVEEMGPAQLLKRWVRHSLTWSNVERPTIHKVPAPSPAPDASTTPAAQN